MIDRANVFTLVLISVLLISTSTVASSKEIIVDGSSGDFRSIQEAVSSSFPGDTIIVRSGTYMGNVVVKKAGLTIRPELENDVLIESLTENESTFLIKADNVSISGFRISGSGEALRSLYRILLEDVNNCSVKGNNFFESPLGVSILNSSSNLISENTFSNKAIFQANGHNNAISIDGNSGQNILKSNILENCYITQGPGSSENLISGNEISNGGGIVIACCGWDNVIYSNKILNCSTGIDVYDQRIRISNNSIMYCTHGIDLNSAGGTKIYNNTILNCSMGVNLGEGCSGIEIINNIIISSAICGIFIPDYEGNEKIYNNYFNNSLNVRLGISEGNFWNNSRLPGVNIAGGPYLGGNLWVKPDGTGFSQTSADSDGDGIGNSPYNISENEFDYLPLISLTGPQKQLSFNGTAGDKNSSNSKFDRIIVKAQSGFPVASFSTNVSEGYAPLSVKFTDNSENATDWNWNFGDKYTSSDQNPEHTYSGAGNFTVNLTVSNEKATVSKTQNITVYEAPVEEKVLPVANFSSNITQGYAPLSVQFTDLSQNIIGRNWSFGEGNTSTAWNPMHIYSKAGKYTVNLTVKNENGTDSKVLEITVFEAPDEEKVLPEAEFSAYPISGYAPLPSAYPISGYAPLSVQFTDQSQNATARNWDFNSDGFSDSNNTTVVYVYTIPGNYIVNLTVSNENGTDSKTLEILVNEMPVDEKVRPVANFSAKPASGNAPLSVQFTDLSQNVTGRNWSFGDGKSSFFMNPVHNYSKAGKYVVNLTVNNENGTDSKILEITVYEAPIEENLRPIANFNVYPTSGNAPLSVHFTDFSQNEASRSWDFNNDGAADSYDISPVYIYTAPGTYKVNLIVTNANGTDNKTAIINVLEGNSPGSSSSDNSNGGSNSGGDNGGDSNNGGSSGGSSKGGSSGSSGGGGAGGSPEPQSNVDVKELSQAFISSGNSVRFDFPRNATSVLYITFDSKKTTGKTTTIIEMLKGKSSLVSQLPSGEVYKSLNIWVGNSGFATPNNIEKAVIYFKVEKSWLQDKNINRNSITLNRYNDKKWNQLPTNLSGEDSNYLYLTAQTSGFSPFVIIGNTIENETITKTQPAAETKVQPAAKIENIVQNNTASQSVQESEQKSEQNSKKKPETGKSSNLPIFGMICLIALLLAAFLFKIDKKP